ncbi:hypothetical protein [Trichloromonas sp.]|uniref:hypothetical protein n=1 Tax=Trichloromonas sp. TaxID=3069249 RepID=UPI003D819DDA
MKRSTLNYREKPQNHKIGKRSMSLFLLLVTGTLLFLSGSISMLVCLLWLGGLFSFFIMLAGMNEDIADDAAPRKGAVIPVAIQHRSINSPRFFSPTHSE